MKSLIIILFILTNALHTQWQSDIRLTNNVDSSFTSYTNAYCIASSSSDVHAVWYDKRDGNSEIYYKRSTDAGSNWGADMRLTNNPSPSITPSISVNNQLVVVVWQDSRDGNEEIYFKRSTNGGTIWGTDIRLTINPAISAFPCIAATGSNLHVVWHEQRDGNMEIYYKHSVDNGITWSQDSRLTNNPAVSWSPSIAAVGSSVHVVWFDQRVGNNEIYYKRSTDGGLNWIPDTRLTNDPGSSTFSSISISGSMVHVTWDDYRNASMGIYYKHSTNNGVNWESETQLSHIGDPAYFPSISSSGSNVHVVWIDSRDNIFEVYYRNSTDGGGSWQQESRLTNKTGESWLPSICVSGTMLHVIWEDNRDGNFEIYYKRNPTGNPIGISPVSNEVPERFMLYQNYPNPFNPATKIKFSIPVGTRRGVFVQLKIYDVLGRQIATLVNEELQPGTYEIDWNGTDYASGIYYYNLEAKQFNQTNKMVLMK